MSPIQTPDQVFDALQKAKTGATAFCTNFFPVESKLQSWIGHGELFGELLNGVALFFRKDRDFWHCYFCAADAAMLQRRIAALSGLETECVVTDLVGNESTLNDLLPVFTQAGFRQYAQLQRMARMGRPGSTTGRSQIVFAEKSDCRAVMKLIENSFDRYGEQLPMLYEIESAIESHQILVSNHNGELAGLLFFETQGFASVVRFWAVAEKFRALKVGSALIRHYFETQNSVRRFTLWVNANNDNAIQKYCHYSYKPDGLVDHILVNKMIRI
ncbi:MAG: GNAT family N-acetyltransferase [Verrucomicrobiota bacterium]